MTMLFILKPGAQASEYALSSGSALSFKSAHCADTLWKPDANKHHQALT